jgi:hypothetical protein
LALFPDFAIKSMKIIHKRPFCGQGNGVGE